MWEANLRNGGQPPPQAQQKTPWGHTPTTNIGGTWGEDDEVSDSSNMWTGVPSNPGPGVGPGPQWGAGGPGGPGGPGPGPAGGMWGGDCISSWPLGPTICFHRLLRERFKRVPRLQVRKKTTGTAGTPTGASRGATRAQAIHVWAWTPWTPATCVESEASVAAWTRVTCAEEATRATCVAWT